MEMRCTVDPGTCSNRDRAVERLAAKVHDQSWILHHSCIGHGIEAGDRPDEDAPAGYGAANFRLEACVREERRDGANRGTDDACTDAHVVQLRVQLEGLGDFDSSSLLDSALRVSRSIESGGVKVR